VNFAYRPGPPVSSAEMLCGARGPQRHSASRMAPRFLRHPFATKLAVERSDNASVRGVHGLCEMYAGIDAQRFESILVQVAAGRSGSALVAGARWPRVGRHNPGIGISRIVRISA
jgi:hypothetical protein